MAQGRQPLLRGTGQSDVTMGGFNILDVGAVGNLQQATIHVDPLMVDDTIGERGTGAPFKTISAAVAAAEAGDTIILRPGVHAFDGAIDIFQLAGLTILGYGAVIKSLSEINETTKFTVRSGSVTFEGMECDGAVTDTPTLTGDGCIEVTAPGFTIRNCFIHSQNGYGIHASENFDGIRVFDCDFEFCLYGIFGESETTATSDTDGIWIKRCNVERNRGSGVAFTGPGPDSGFFLTRIQISDCQLTRNDSDGDGVAAIALTFACQGVEVNDNHIKDESKGILLSQVRGASVSGNYLKGMATTGIQLAGCIGVKINDNIHDSRNEAGTPTTTSPILISGQYAAPNDAAQFIITGNELIFPKTAAASISISNAGAVIINSNRIEGTIALAALISVMVNGNLFVIPQTTQAILIDSSNRGSSKISIIGNRYNFTGASINRCVTTVDASATGIDDVLIEGNATPIGLTFGIAAYGHSGSNRATNVVLIGNTPESTLVTTGWVNVGVSLSVKRVFVSQSRGVDATGERQSRNFKFQTINAAITAAASGDVIIVEDGTFNERLDFKAGLFTLRFLEPSRLVSSDTNGCIRSTATGAFWKVYHEHATIENSQDNVPTVSWTHAGSLITIYGPIYNSGAGGSARAINCTDGIVELFGSAVSSAGHGIALTVGAPVVHVHGGLTTNPYDILGNGTGLGVLLSHGEFIAHNCKIYSVGAAAVDLQLTNASIVRFKQCTLLSGGASSPALSISTPGAIVPLLRDCVLVSGASATQSIAAGSAQNVKLYGHTVANKGADPPTNITFQGGGAYDVNANVTED